MSKQMGYASPIKESHVSFEMVRMTLLKFIMKAKSNAFCEKKSPLLGLHRDQNGSFCFLEFLSRHWNRFSYDFCYLMIRIKLLSYFFLFFKILICFGHFSDSINISEDYEYSFFSYVLCVSVLKWVSLHNLWIQS